MPTALNPAPHPDRLTLALAGLVWLARAGIALAEPDYWRPRTLVDYAAVVGTSLGLVLLAAGVGAFYRHHPAPLSRAQRAWRAGVWLTWASALTIGVSNLLEDAVGLRALGSVWVIGIVTLLIGLLIAGASAFWVPGLRWPVGGLLLVCALGLLFIEWNGMFAMGLALFALGLAKGNPV